MTKPIIGLYGACVASCLVDVLGNMPGITREFSVESALTFNREPMPPERLSACVLHIAQDRINSYSFPTPEVEESIRPDSTILKLPHLIFSSLWPLTCVDPRNVPDAENPLGRHLPTQTDRIALDIMGRISDPAARRAEYLATDLSLHVDLARHHEIEIEQMVARERTCDIQVAAHILATFRTERLFFAAHHPTPSLMLYLVAQIVAHPLFAPFRRASVDSLLAEAAAFLDSTRPFAGEEVPIHPQVARFFELEWWSPDLLYGIHRRHFRFEEWLDHYMTDPLPAAGSG